MKLLHKTALYLLLAAIPIALGGGLLLKVYIHRELVHEIDELLASELIQLKEQLRQKRPTANDLPRWDPTVRILGAPSSAQAGVSYSDTVVFNPVEKEHSNIRMLRSPYSVGNQTYVITLQQSYLEFDEMASTLSVGVIGCFLIVVMALLLADVLINRRIWRPFLGIIRQLKHYRIDEPDDTTFPFSDVYEFTLLSQSLDEMSRRARRQYAQQKQFIDNASHEMQTPLSVLSFELDLLQQSEGLNEADLKRIQRSQQEIKRLSGMNQSLLLLARIDNKQFSDHESVNIGLLVDQLLNNYSDYMAHRGITLNRLVTNGPILLSINRQLAEVLFSNLIKNAVRHSDSNSSILVQVGSQSFIITNQGNPLPFSADQLFQRFVRNPALPQSTGLGLALVKEIATLYGMRVNYDYASAMHRHIFQVDF